MAKGSESFGTLIKNPKTKIQNQWLDPRWPLFSVDLELTNSCGNACAFCPRAKMTRPIGFMEEAVFERIAEQLIQIPSRVAFSGMGNPLLHPKLSQYIHLYKSIGGIAGLVLHAGNLTPEVQQRLFDAGPSFIEISFPTLRPEVFQLLCPDFSLDECREHVIGFHRSAGKRITISVIGMESALNPDEAGSFREFWRRQGLTARVFPCHSRGGNLKADHLITASRQESGPCGLFAMHGFITWQGHMLACCHDLSGDTEIGDAASEDLLLLGGRKAELLEKGLPFEICQTCDEPRKSLPVPARPFPESEKARSRFLRSSGKALKFRNEGFP